MFGTWVDHAPSEHRRQGTESVDVRKCSARVVAWRRQFSRRHAKFLQGNSIAHPGLAGTDEVPHWHR